MKTIFLITGPVSKKEIGSLCGDTIILFKHGGKLYKYKLCENFLHCRNGNNRSILDRLGITDDQVDELYGYPSLGGIWPCFRWGDFATVVRVINYIYARTDVVTETDIQKFTTVVRISETDYEAFRTTICYNWKERLDVRIQPKFWIRNGKQIRRSVRFPTLLMDDIPNKGIKILKKFLVGTRSNPRTIKDTSQE